MIISPSNGFGSSMVTIMMLFHSLPTPEFYVHNYSTLIFASLHAFIPLASYLICKCPSDFEVLTRLLKKPHLFHLSPYDALCSLIRHSSGYVGLDKDFHPFHPSPADAGLSLQTRHCSRHSSDTSVSDPGFPHSVAPLCIFGLY